MRPSVGRVVHYTSYGTPGGEYMSECRAAIVTAVRDGSTVVDLCAVNPEGLFFNRAVEQLEPGRGKYGLAGGTWHWPERVEG